MIPTGIWLFPDKPVAEIVHIARMAEEHGFSYCWLGDEGFARDVYISMAAIAQATKTLKIGVGITNPYTRHPAITAVAIATLDELSGGRAFLGLGAGGSLTLNPLNLHAERPVSTCIEAITIARRLFRKEKVDFSGKRYQLKGASLAFGRPNIEIYVAGRGSRMLEMGGQYADGVLLSGKAKFDLENTISDIKRGAAESQNDPKIIYATNVAYDEDLPRDIRPHYTYMIADSPSHVKERLGVSPALEQDIRAEMAKNGIESAARFVTDEMLKQFIIMGDRTECASEIRALVQTYGFAQFVVPLTIASFDKAADILSNVAAILQKALHSP
ncbi:MAG: LLM class flavin-dependent oxidoreductase [Chloroflexi bacterium]|nr:LLM class flavin-dependent oxidoreductase [Chloroflexota bacterium]MCL5075373.1 LLM class flavin-dependent oxidoreductase [Chloroflexota bacterium]